MAAPPNEPVLRDETPKSPPPPQGPSAPRLGAPAGQLAAWVVAAVINGVFIVATVPLPSGGTSVRVLHHLVDAGQLLGLGLAASAAAELGARLPRRAVTGPALVYLAALALGQLVLRTDLEGVAQSIAPSALAAATHGLIAAVAFLPVVAVLACRLPDLRRWLAVPLGVLGLGGLIGHQLVLVGDYPGLHLVFAVVSATLLGGGLSAAPRPALKKRPALGLGLRGVGALGAAASLVLWPGSTVMVEVFKVPGAVVAPFAAQLSRRSAAAGAVTFGDPAWFKDRSGAEPIAAGAPLLASGPPIVIVLLVDCMRADLLTKPANADKLPHMRALRDEGLFFTDARSPAPATTQSVASIFTSRTYSQLVWTFATVGKDPRVYPHLDTSLRFTEVLSKAGTRTMIFTGLSALKNEYGVVRGLDEEHILSASMLSDGVVQKVEERLKKDAAGPQFFYVHVADAHSPYDRAGKKGSAFDRYLGEVGIVDKALGQLREALRAQGLAERTVIVLTADHGEAFGEHNDTLHAHTLYDELLRVPLVMYVPGATPRRIDTPVSLLDLGPTVLDLFGLPTPGSYMGQSLAPFARGADPKLTRPIVAESARRMQIMVFPDQVKVIRDLYRGTVEVYDLARDPGELKNLYDEHAGEREPHVAELAAFFEAQTLSRPGYEVPYQKW